MSKYAIITSGGRQYRVEENRPVILQRLPGHQPGDTVQFEQVLLVHDDQEEAIGTPYLEGARVSATVVEEFKGEKIRVFKYKPKKRYRRRYGHRDRLIKLLVGEIRR
ncbi:MAG TPA: 50S ribosomal protein L21 [Candidatus Fraserbacteria bacterium]|nr:50S ribosomal protein L21 [Candidatus Fraserbacteria bacterium]